MNLSSFGVVEVSSIQNYTQSNLDLLYLSYLSVLVDISLRFAAFDGSFNDSNGPDIDLIKLGLNLQYSIALTYPRGVAPYQVGDGSAGDFATNDSFEGGMSLILIAATLRFQIMPIRVKT